MGSWAIIHRYLIKCDPWYIWQEKLFLYFTFMTQYIYIASLVVDSQKNGQKKPLLFSVIQTSWY